MKVSSLSFPSRGANIRVNTAFIPAFIIITMLFMLVAMLNGERARWQWGKKRDRLEDKGDL